MLTGLGWIWDDLGVCVAPQRESCYELVAPAHVRMCIVTSSPAIPCSGKKVLRKVVDWKVEYNAWHSTMRYDQFPWWKSRSCFHPARAWQKQPFGKRSGQWWQWTMFSHIDPSCWIILSPNLRSVCKRLQLTLLGQLAMCVKDATTRLCHFERAEISKSASIWLIAIRRQDFFSMVMWNEMLLDLDGFGMIWVCVCVCCPAAWELLRAGSTCPCQNVHRDIIPCNSLLRQKGVEKSCWLESWILCMAFHNAVWLISMVKIKELFPSCTGMTKETWTTVN